MSQAETFDDEEFRDEPRKKKGGIPAWLWLGCGGGCLGMILIIAIGAFLMKGAVEKAVDPEQQWPELQKVLPFDERPTDLDMTMGMKVPLAPFRQFVLMDTAKNLQVTVYHMTRDADEGVEELMKERPASAFMRLGILKDAAFSTFQIQGQEVPCVTFTGISGQDFPGGPGGGVRVNLHAAGLDGTLVELRMIGSKDVPTELDVEEFFTRFQLW